MKNIPFNDFNFGMEPAPSGERRSTDRFPIEREVRYKVVSKRSGNESGAGKTVNFSSGGVLFTTEQMLIPGKKIELAISWPAQLDSTARQTLAAAVSGVARTPGAVEIPQYEVRTMGAPV